MEALILFLSQFKTIIDYAALVGGLLNAGALFLQGYKVWRSRDVSSMSLVMFFVFLFIQTSYFFQSIINRNLWLGIGVITSAVPTVWIITMIYRYRGQPKRQQLPRI